MMLKEYSGRPPPRISSRPGTPVGSCRMVTRSLDLVLACSWSSLDSSMLFVQRCVGPSLAHQAQREGFADESDQQPEQMGGDRDCRLGAQRSSASAASSSSPSREPSALTVMPCSAGTSARARASARRRSDVKPSAPANRVRETRSFSQTRTASCTCGSAAVWLAASTASNRRAKSRIDADGISIIE